MTRFHNELNTALRAVWIVVSFAILLILAAPFLLGGARVARLAPVCRSKVQTGRPCSFCGMTTGFLAISGGRFKDAGHSSRGSVPLYATFVANEIALLIFIRKGGLSCKP